MNNFEGRNGNYETKRRGQESRDKTACSKKDNSSFRHDMNKRAKSAQPNPSPSSSTRQNERNASRTRSPRGKSPSRRMSRLPCKDYLKGTCTTPFCENGILQNACSASLRMNADWVKSALMRIARLMNSLAKGLKKEW